MAARARRLAVGQDVIVTWLDSGLGTSDAPGKPARLVFKTTHGRVSWVGRDDEIHRRCCRRGKRCVCWAVELVMCSSGDDDTGTDLAVIWMPAIVEVRVWK